MSLKMRLDFRQIDASIKDKNCIKYSMRELIYDVINDCVWSYDELIGNIAFW